MRRAVQSILVGAFLAGAACNPSDAAAPLPTDATIVGVYHLTIVNGGQLPYPVAGDGNRLLDLSGGTLTLNADHTFTDALTYRLIYASGSPPPTDNTVVDSGTYVLYNRNIAMTYSAGADTIAVTGDLLQKTNAGLLLTYSK